MTNNKAVIKSIGQKDWQTNRRTDGRSDEHIEWRWITYHDNDLTLTHHLKHLHKYSPKHICMYTQQDWGEYFERIKKIPKKNSAEHWIDGAKRREHTSPSLAPAVECNRILKKMCFWSIYTWRKFEYEHLYLKTNNKIWIREIISTLWAAAIQNRDTQLK